MSQITKVIHLATLVELFMGKMIEEGVEEVKNIVNHFILSHLGIRLTYLLIGR